MLEQDGPAPVYGEFDRAGTACPCFDEASFDDLLAVDATCQWQETATDGLHASLQVYLPWMFDPRAALTIVRGELAAPAIGGLSVPYGALVPRSFLQCAPADLSDTIFTSTHINELSLIHI